MIWLYYIFVAAVLEEMASLFNAIRNYRYVLSKHRKDNQQYLPNTVLIVPCKGVDPGFDDNIASLYRQAYDGYQLWFVVSDTSDPAYPELLKIRREQLPRSKAKEARILIAGLSEACSQKLHNLVFCCRQLPEDVEVIAFADSDMRASPGWLANLVWPLRSSKVGATTGYRWLVPDRTNLASLALSAINAKVVQMLGNTRWNLAWGGSMAIRKDLFQSLRIDDLWARSLTDDLTLTSAVKGARLKVAFVPACIVPSHQSATWRSLWEFGRRQFVITRWYRPRTWWLALLGALLSALEPWAAAALAVLAGALGWTVTVWHYSFKAWPFWAVAAGLLLASGFHKAVFRQKLGRVVLMDDSPGVRAAARMDLLAFWAWPPIMLALILASAFGRTILWRGILYRISGPGDIEVVSGRRAG
jgi:cellulose synthase/poly-beta-1,6-N-acetylglucosamine synthase-like glycosyltransferase